MRSAAPSNSQEADMTFSPPDDLTDPRHINKAGKNLYILTGLEVFNITEIIVIIYHQLLLYFFMDILWFSNLKK